MWVVAKASRIGALCKYIGQEILMFMCTSRHSIKACVATALLAIGLTLAFAAPGNAQTASETGTSESDENLNAGGSNDDC